jgi:hypothetical protein
MKQQAWYCKVSHQFPSIHQQNKTAFSAEKNFSPQNAVLSGTEQYLGQNTT